MTPKTDIVLSSGFLAFAEQAGFLRALEERELVPATIVGTSSGALAGALWWGGSPARAIFEELCATAPLWQLRLHARPWAGLLSLEPVMQQLRTHLPADFAALDTPLGVGVVDEQRQPVLLTEGPVACAVAASCAIPWLFQAVTIGERTYQDGGVADRTALAAWQTWRPNTDALLHLVDRTSGAPHTSIPDRVQVIRSPRSGAQLWNLGDTEGRYQAARRRTLKQLDGVA